MHEHDPSRVFDDHPFGWAETPGDTAVEAYQESDVRTEEDLPEGVKRGPLGEFIKGHLSEGSAVGVILAGPKQVRVFIAKHPDLIKATSIVTAGVVTVGSVVAAVIFVREHHNPGPKK